MDHDTTTMALLRPLAEVLAEHDHLAVPFPATVSGRPVTVRAVLQRTAVVHPPGDDGPEVRHLVRLNRITVDPADLRWVTETQRSTGHQWPRSREQRRCRGCGRMAAHVDLGPSKGSWCADCERKRLAARHLIVARLALVEARRLVSEGLERAA
ncbi:MAG: hypothetical protein M3024_02050 [Candidatus Dormibacteraeota bacterium]|nr:hypothetical protein [Candidatus Dormibacteraeota bacterium]